MYKIFTAVSLLAALLAFQPVQAQTSANKSPTAATSTTATYGAWTVRCNSVAKAGETAMLCEMIQSLRIRQSGQVLMEIALGRLAKTEPVSMLFKVPSNVWLRSVISVSLGDKVKDKPDFEATYFRCQAQFCLADIKLSDDQQAELQKLQSIVVGFVDGTRKTIHVPVSLNGFSAAFNSVFASTE